MGNVSSRTEPALDAGKVKSAIFALLLWMGNLQISAVEGLSQSHQPSFASREGMVILRGHHRFAGGLWKAAVQLPGRSSARVQDFHAVSVQARLCARVRETSLIRAMV